MARINGRDRMRKVLKALPKTTRNKIRGALLAGGEDMANVMRRLVPFDQGDLRDSIKVTPADQLPEVYNKARSRRKEKDADLAVIVHVDEFYAALVEFGTPPHINLGQFPGTSHPGTRGQPYFWPGYRSQKKRVIARINKAARQGIKEGLR